MTPFGRGAKALEPVRWPFTGREEELELVRRSLTAVRHGIVVTGPAGCGKTRLVEEAVRGADRARVAGTPGTRETPFAAFAHLLPESVTQHRALHLLSGVRLLVVDDAHLLDDASAALVHQLALHARTRLVVVATDGVPAPGAVRRLWTGELLPRLELEPLPREEADRLVTAAAGGPVEPLTARRLHRLCAGDLRLLRDLLGAVEERGLLVADPDTGARAWHGPLPLTPAVHERAAAVLDRTDPAERATLERLAFAEPLPLDAADCDLGALERLESEGLILVMDDPRTPDAVRLAHPLHGPALRAAAGRLRARRLAGTSEETGLALKTEAATLERRIEEADVRDLPTPAGDWLTESGIPVPAPYAAVRARFCRLRGELHEAAAWSRLALRHTPEDEACLLELALSTAQSGDLVGHDTGWPASPRAHARSSRSERDDEAPTARRPHRVPRGARAEDRPATGAEQLGVEPTGALRGDRAAAGAVQGPAARGGGLSGDVPPAAATDVRAEPTGALPGDRSVAGAAQHPAGRADLPPAEAAQLHAEPAGAPPGDRPPAADAIADAQHPAPRGVLEGPAPGRLPSAAAVWFAAAQGDLDGALAALGDDRPYDAVRLGAPERALGVLPAGGVFAAHAEALARGDGPALDRVAEALRERGFVLFAAEAHAQAARVHRDPLAARTARTRAVALARRCQGARTPALTGLVLGELTARQRQIVTLAAAGLSNRQIAERLTLSVRTVGNHLYGAYTRLGGDRRTLPCLVAEPDSKSA
ncbi:LuxR C-terminal-related transcriptional regulator [Streptomyces sp. SAI-170]|uniref:LuxR C-terminal-related transcriptional regulator n=1 Tax=Streptomyces sp. SAI-170 TaxID=3377729 RepID=UPI003C7A28EF